MKRLRWLALLPLLLAGALQATSHCYKQRSNCFVEKNGRDDVKMYIKRDRFAEIAKKHGLSEARIEEIIKKGEGREEYGGREDLRDERGYYGGVYWPHPIYAYPPHYGHPHHPHHPHRPDHRPPTEKPPKKPVTIQPTENPVFNRPRPGGPSIQPVRKPAARPVTRPAARPARPVSRPVRRAR